MSIDTKDITETISKSKPNAKANTIKQYEAQLLRLKKMFDSDNYDSIIKHAFERNNTLQKIFLIPVWYKLKKDSNIDELVLYLKNTWEPIIKKNKKIFFYYLDELDQASPNNYKRLFLFSTYHYDIVTKLKYDIEYDVLKNFG